MSDFGLFTVCLVLVKGGLPRLRGPTGKDISPKPPVQKECCRIVDCRGVVGGGVFPGRGDVVIDCGGAVPGREDVVLD